MAKRLEKSDLKELARIGARTRLEELRREEAAIIGTFPELKAQRKAAPDGPAPARRRRARGMSPAARKAVSERMKRYWANRRKSAGQKTAAKK